MSARIGGYSVNQLRLMAEQRKRALLQEQAKLRRQISQANNRLEDITDELRQLEATEDLIA